MLKVNRRTALVLQLCMEKLCVTTNNKKGEVASYTLTPEQLEQFRINSIHAYQAKVDSTFSNKSPVTTNVVIYAIDL